MCVFIECMSKKTQRLKAEDVNTRGFSKVYKKNQSGWVGEAGKSPWLLPPVVFYSTICYDTHLSWINLSGCVDNWKVKSLVKPAAAAEEWKVHPVLSSFDYKCKTLLGIFGLYVVLFVRNVNFIQIPSPWGLRIIYFNVFACHRMNHWCPQ